MAPKMPKAFARSLASVNVVVSSERAAGREERAEQALQRAAGDEHLEVTSCPGGTQTPGSSPTV
ncbi:hypothetical protein SMCF_5798 [Streptomyces coelicoflavus ZG0656]|nr:hypothetical protein SMCF_5798 [Streptomyces coelicoflavus ZG0656]